MQASSKQKKTASLDKRIRPIVDFETGCRLVEKERLSSSWPSLYYETIDQLIELSGSKNVLEVGVASGWHAKHLLQKFPKLKYTGVDPYIANYDSNDQFSDEGWRIFGGENPQEALDLLHEIVSQKLSNLFGKRFKLIRTTSETYFNSSAAKYDLIFIDGDHRYDNVLSDLELAWSSLSPKGVICGDDYLWPEVEKAVHDFSQAKSLEPILISNITHRYPIYFFRKTSR
jgi:predicted O-methyltransferase YrrM